MESTASLLQGIHCPQGDDTWQARDVFQIVGKVHFLEGFLHHVSLQARLILSQEFYGLHHKQAGHWKFLRFTYSGSCSDGAIMRTWVPSMAPITPGNCAMPKKSAWCFLIMSGCTGKDINLLTIRGCTRAVVILWIILDTVDWWIPKLSPLHSCIRPVAKYLNVTITCTCAGIL